MRPWHGASTLATSAVEMRNALAVLRISLHPFPPALSDYFRFLADSAVNLRTSWTLAVSHTLARKLHSYY